MAVFRELRGVNVKFLSSYAEDKNLTFTPRNSRKTAIVGPDFDGT